MSASIVVELFLFLILRWLISRSLAAVGYSEGTAVALSVAIALALWCLWLYVRRRVLAFLFRK